MSYFGRSHEELGKLLKRICRPVKASASYRRHVLKLLTSEQAQETKRPPRTKKS